METLCGLFGKRRQGYYQRRDTVISELQRRKILTDYIEFYRSQCPRVGGVKLYHLLESDLGRDMTRGRDAFLRFYGESGFGLPKCKPIHTTDSKHLYLKYPNIIQGIEAQCVNHIWAADITYVWIAGDVLYLHLLTDAYSHAVLGWCLSETLEAENTIESLKMAVETAGGDNLCGTIHHSDRGAQYACNGYVDMLMQHHIRISMTERYNPTDNPVAERVNGIFKVEWIYNQEQFADWAQALEGIRRMIYFYNNVRPHMSIGMKTPMAVYRSEEPGRNLWKKK